MFFSLCVLHNVVSTFYTFFKKYFLVLGMLDCRLNFAAIFA